MGHGGEADFEASVVLNCKDFGIDIDLTRNLEIEAVK